MPDLNLSAAVAGTAGVNPPPARGPSAAADLNASAFGDAMAQANSNHTVRNESAAPPENPDAAADARDARCESARSKRSDAAANSGAAEPAATGKDEATEDGEPAAAAAMGPGDIAQAQALAAPAAAAQAALATPGRAGAPTASDAADSVAEAAGKGAQPAPRGRHAGTDDAPLAAHASPAREASDHRSPRPAHARRLDRDDAVAQGSDGKHAPAAHDGNDPLPALASSTNAAARDRLSEDFQQRFERALTAATATAPRGELGLAQSAAAGWSTATPAAATQGVAQIAVPTPVGAAAFSDDFSGRVALLTRGKVHSAEISLSPADLGPVSVSIEVRGTEATLVFGAAHAATRSAIEDALPRLRDMLGAQGLQLADARVGTHSGGDSPRREQRAPRAATGAIEAAAAPNAAAPAITLRSTRLIDVIA